MFNGDNMTNEEDFAEFVKEKHMVVRPVVVDGKLVGWITWDGGHTLNFWNTKFENIDMRSVGDFSKSRISFKTFLKEANEYIKDIRREYRG